MKQRSNKPLYENKFKVKQPKTFWRGLMDKLHARMHYVPPEQRVLAHAHTVAHAPPAEAANLLASALFAKKTLDSTRHIDIAFPEKLLASEGPVSEPARELLAAYITELEKFQVDLIERDTPVTLATARGLPTWIISFYTLTIPGLEQHGLDIWKKLMTAEANLEEAYRFLLRREPTDVERASFTYRPKRFLR